MFTQAPAVEAEAEDRWQAGSQPKAWGMFTLKPFWKREVAIVLH